MIQEIVISFSFIMILILLIFNILYQSYFPFKEYDYNEVINFDFPSYNILDQAIIASDKFKVILYDNTTIVSSKYNILNHIAYVPDGYSNGTIIDGEAIKVIPIISDYAITSVVFLIFILNITLYTAYPILKKIIKKMH